MERDWFAAESGSLSFTSTSIFKGNRKGVFLAGFSPSMAGKLSILVGAGILGSILAKEGRMPSFSDVISGCPKPIKQSNSASTTSKPRNDALVAEATRNEIASKLDELSNKFDDIIACSNSTKEEVAAVSGEVSNFAADLQEVNDTIRTLETRMGRIQGKQDETTEGVGNLVIFARKMENRFTLIQDSPSGASRPAIEQVATPSSSVSLPLTLEPSSPSTSCGSNEANGDPSNASSTSGLTEYQKNSGAVENKASPRLFRRCNVTEITEKSPSPELSVTQPNVKSAGLLSRTVSATRNFRFM